MRGNLFLLPSGAISSSSSSSSTSSTRSPVGAALGAAVGAPGVRCRVFPGFMGELSAVCRGEDIATMLKLE